MPQPPKFQPRRRNARNGPVQLPASGRQGDIPRWPLAVKATRDESDVWKLLWRTPQSDAWEDLGWDLTVARYCRVVVAASQPGAQPGILKAAGDLEDRLGLTPKAMRLLLWQIGSDGDEAPEVAGNVLDIRQRIAAVD